MTGKKHTIKEHPPLESLIGHDDYACLTRVVIRTTPETARRNRDTNYFMGLVEECEMEDGRIEQVYMTYSTEMMARWVLGHGDTTEAVSPEEVKLHIKRIIESYANQQY
jgi:predicted DNA-binding transcriptional regulator YafY